MKHIEALNQIMDGKNLRFGLYLGSKAELGKMRVDTGGTRTFPILTHSVKVGDDILPVKEDVGDDFRPETFKPPFTFGTPIIIAVKSSSKDKAFNQICYGTLLVLDDPRPALKVA